MVRSINTLKGWFETLDKPTQEQFWDWMDSFRHRNDAIPVADVQGLIDILNSFQTNDAFTAFEQGDLQEYNEDATYDIPPGYELEKIMIYYGEDGTITISKEEMGGNDIYPAYDIAAGWNDPLMINKFFPGGGRIYLQGIPNGSKIIFFTRKCKIN